METVFADKAFEMCIHYLEGDGRSMMQLPISIAFGSIGRDFKFSRNTT
jgi:hypothetical protein